MRLLRDRAFAGWLPVLLAAGAFAALFTWFGTQRLYGLRAGRDLGLFLQSLLNAGRGAGLSNTLEGDHFSVHNSPILFLAVPWAAAFPHPQTLIAAAAILIGAAALPLYGFARAAGLAQRSALAVALLYLAYPAVHGFAFYNDFNENVFVPVLAFAAAWAYAARRLPLFFAAAAALLLVKEDQGIFICWAAIALAAVQPDRGRRAPLLVLATLALLSAATYVLAHPQPAGAQFYAGGPFTLVPQKAGSLLELLVPLACLPLAAGRVWLLAIPLMIELYAASNSALFRIGSHYEIPFVSFLFIALVIGLRRPAQTQRALAAAAVLTLAAVLLTDPSPLRAGPRYRYTPAVDEGYLTLTRSWLRAGDAVAVPEEYFAFVADYPNATWNGATVRGR